MSTESFTTNKKERMQEGVSLAQGEKKHLAGQQLTPRYEVVQQLKDARKAQDMTQEVLAERVGTKKSNISRFESGKYNPSLDFLIKVAGSLGKQSRKTRRERLLMKQPFTLCQSDKKLANQKICLVDNVYTTGRTLRHAAQCLIVAGALEVTSLTLAR